MTIPLLISCTTVVCMITSVLLKPNITIGRVKIGLYWLICAVGALCMICFGGVSIKSAINGITANTIVNPLKILTLFLSMALLSIFLGDAGFFYLIANKVFSHGKNAGKKLFLLLYLAVSVLTVFTSNDIVILTFTPPICIFSKKAKISPIPYLIGEFVAANTWSMALIIGNPTNIYLAQTAGVSFWQYFATMCVPTIVGGVVSLALLLLIFNKKLSKTPMQDNQSSQQVELDKPAMIVAIILLLATIITLSISDIFNLESWKICLFFAILLTAFNLIYNLVKYKNIVRVVNSIKKAPYELIPFIISMFVIVLGLENCNLTNYLCNLLITGEKFDALSFTFLSAGSANLLNNIPMSVLFEKIINAKSYYALFGAIAGSNIGAFITPVGALAGIMWNKIIGEYDVKLSFAKFVLYGIIIAIPTLFATGLTIALI